MSMDTQTLEHLNAWLETYVPDQERAETRERIITVYESDPEFWSKHSWPEMRDWAESINGE